MTLLYFKLGIVGILGGLLMIAAGLDMHWQGALAILAGLVALVLGIRNVTARSPADGKATSGARPADGPYTAEDFPPVVQPTGPSGLRCIITTSEEEPVVWLVTYGDFTSFMISDDPESMPRRAQLALAFRASPGAELGEPVEVGYQNLTGLLEDDYHWYRCRVAPTPANAAALQAVGFSWDDEARHLADQFGVLEETVKQVRETMRRLARQDLQDARRIREEHSAPAVEGEAFSEGASPSSS